MARRRPDTGSNIPVSSRRCLSSLLAQHPSQPDVDNPWRLLGELRTSCEGMCASGKRSRTPRWSQGQRWSALEAKGIAPGREKRERSGRGSLAFRGIRAPTARDGRRGSYDTVRLLNFQDQLQRRRAIQRSSNFEKKERSFSFGSRVLPVFTLWRASKPLFFVRSVRGTRTPRQLGDLFVLCARGVCSNS